MDIVIIAGKTKVGCFITKGGVISGSIMPEWFDSMRPTISEEQRPLYIINIFVVEILWSFCRIL